MFHEDEWHTNQPFCLTFHILLRQFKDDGLNFIHRHTLFSYCTCLLDLYPTCRNSSQCISYFLFLQYLQEVHSIQINTRNGMESDQLTSLDQHFNEKYEAVVYILQFGRIVVTKRYFYTTHYFLSMVSLILILTQYQLDVPNLLSASRQSKTKQKHKMSITIRQDIFSGRERFCYKNSIIKCETVTIIIGKFQKCIPKNVSR